MYNHVLTRYDSPYALLDYRAFQARLQPRRRFLRLQTFCGDSRIHTSPCELKNVTSPSRSVFYRQGAYIKFNFAQFPRTRSHNIIAFVYVSVRCSHEINPREINPCFLVKYTIVASYPSLQIYMRQIHKITDTKL